MKRKSRVILIALVAIFLLGAVTVGALCGALYCAVGDAFPEGDYSTSKAWKLWRNYVEVCKQESRNPKDSQAYYFYQSYHVNSSEALDQMKANQDYKSVLCHKEEIFEGASPWVGVKKLDIEGLGEIKVKKAYGVTYSVLDLSVKAIYETSAGNIYSYHVFGPNPEIYYFKEDEFFRFVNDNAALRSEWKDPNPPDELTAGHPGAPTLMADISNYETLNVTLLYDDTPAWVLPTAICGGAVVLAAAVAVPTVILRRKKRKAAAAGDGETPAPDEKE